MKCLRNLWFLKSPSKSGKWAKEFPKQITASNPPFRKSASESKLNQLASSTTKIRIINSVNEKRNDLKRLKQLLLDKELI